MAPMETVAAGMLENSTPTSEGLLLCLVEVDRGVATAMAVVEGGDHACVSVVGGVDAVIGTDGIGTMAPGFGVDKGVVDAAEHAAGVDGVTAIATIVVAAEVTDGEVVRAGA